MNLAHPYFPEGISLSGDIFIANSWPVTHLILAFSLGCTAILAVTWLIVKCVNPRLRRSDQLLVLWFVMTGSIHVFFEGYFVFNHARMPSRGDFFGQLWKEYALSDSRYMSSDPVVLCMEALTMVTWGPLSWLTAVLITKNSAYRHPVQALVSTGQFYGNLIYYSTSLFEDFSLGKRYYRPEPLYFWVYFVLMNGFWLVIPALCLYSSIKASVAAFRVSSRMSMNGMGKKIS